MENKGWQSCYSQNPELWNALIERLRQSKALILNLFFHRIFMNQMFFSPLYFSVVFATLKCWCASTAFL